MKSLETQIAEARAAITNSPKFKGVHADLPKCATLEETLARTKEFADKRGISLTESRPRVQRKNGSTVVTGSDSTERVQRAAKEFHCSIQEATVILGLPLSAAEKSEVSELAEAWKSYAPALTESEAITLAKRGVPVPR